MFTKDGHVRQVKADVVAVAGKPTDVNIAQSGEFTDLDEFFAQDALQFGADTDSPEACVDVALTIQVRGETLSSIRPTFSSANPSFMCS